MAVNEDMSNCISELVSDQVRGTYKWWLTTETRKRKLSAEMLSVYGIRAIYQGCQVGTFEFEGLEL